MNWDRIQLALIVAATTGVVAVATATSRIFDAPYDPVYAVVAPIVSAVIAAANPSRRLVLRVLPQLLVCVVLTALAVNSRGGDLGRQLAKVPFQGLSDIVAARWPAPSEPLSVGAMVLAVAITGAVVAELAWSRRYAAVLVGPTLALLLLVTLLSPQAGPTPLPILLVVVAASALCLRLAYVARLQREQRLSLGTEKSSNALVLSVIGLVAILPVAIGAPFGSSDRFDLRDQQKAISSITEEISPLSRLDEWRGRQPATELFTVSPADPEGRWRFVALTRYDGASWMPSGDFQPVGERLAEQVGRTPVERYQVTIGDFEESWAPFAGVPLQTDLDARTDTTVSGIRTSDRLQAGDTYDLSLTDPQPTPEQLRSLSIDRAELAQLAPLQLGPEDARTFSTIASDVVEGATTDFDRANAIASYLTNDFRLGEEAPAGHRLSQLRVFLTSSKVGRDEQFVAAFTILARLVGLPARVAVGVDLTTTGNESVAWSNDVVTWPEIAFEGAGWVAFDPVPTRLAQEQQAAGAEEPAEAAHEVAPPPTTQPREESSTSAPPIEPDVSETGLPVAARLAIAGSLLGLALLSYVLVVLSLKKKRRRRRASAVRPDERITGAFLTGVEHAVDLGAEALPSLTNHELYLSTARVVDDAADPLAELSSLATRAVYDRHMPTDVIADEAWEESQRAVREMLRSVGWWRWTRARISLRSLRMGTLERPDEAKSKSRPVRPSTSSERR